ncbi:uncharacterized protein LOC134742685 [Cydia strobilella]|uniref:uncharacterized protein LOC134742685 n=1 Tax=Cydia strobilella TaxID=1100964 RepID=UPI003007C4DB
MRKTSHLQRMQQRVQHIELTQHAPTDTHRREAPQVSRVRQVFHRQLQPVLPSHDPYKEQAPQMHMVSAFVPNTRRITCAHCGARRARNTCDTRTYCGDGATTLWQT